MKRVLVTGASGFLGSALIKAFISKTDLELIAVTDHPNRIESLLEKAPSQLSIISNEQMFSGKMLVDSVINCAFARSNDPSQLAGALDYTSRLVSYVKANGVNDLVNISSQGVYKRKPFGVLSKETDEILPIDLYSMCKYATEQITRCGMQGGFCTNIRLSSLNMDGRFLGKFVDAAIKNNSICLTAPTMCASLLDVSDAVDALVRITCMPKEKRSHIYNLGTGYQMTLLDYAEAIKAVGNELGYSVCIEITAQNDAPHSGMDCSLLFQDINWEPSVTVEQMVKNLFWDKRVIKGGIQQ